MREERFLLLFNELEKILRKECRIKDDQYEDMGTLLSKAKEASHHNPVRSHWDNLYVARHLRNLMVHERRQNLTSVAEPSEQLLGVLEEVISQYQDPMTIISYLAAKQVPRPTCFMETDPLTQALSLVHHKRYSQFPIFSPTGYLGMVSENGIAHWLAKTLEEGDTILDLLKAVQLKDILALEEDRDQVVKIHKEASLYQLVSLFERANVTTVLVCNHPNCKLISPQDLTGIITGYDLAEIYREIE